MLKKKSIKPDQEEFSKLDSAVVELSKQTEALLGAIEPSNESKPKLPKKHDVVRHKPKHFDIIHDTKQTKLRATLKAVPKPEEKQKLLADPREVYESAKEAEPAELSSTSAAVVHSHKEGILQTASIRPAANTEDPEPFRSAAEESEVPVLIEPSAVRHSISFGNEAKNAPEEVSEHLNQGQIKEPLGENLSKDQEELTPTEEEADSSKIRDESTADSEHNASADNPVEAISAKADSNAYRGELNANNLVKEAQPKGYEAHSTDKPVVFDTDEYHPELHDWSKLEHRPTIGRLLLVLAVVIVGAVAYIMLTDQNLPF